jgi:hypothetical protein
MRNYRLLYLNIRAVLFITAMVAGGVYMVVRALNH